MLPNACKMWFGRGTTWRLLSYVRACRLPWFTEYEYFRDLIGILPWGIG